MPYIKQEQRSSIDEGLAKLLTNTYSDGELNYIISKLLINNMGQISYSKINEAIGVLECAKLELYRRIASPYEDIKIKVNGDIIK